MQGDDFQNMISISGSFWYEKFTEWLRTSVKQKTGLTYLSLGNKEPKQRNRLFCTLDERTTEVFSILQQAGIDTRFEKNPGNHYQDGQLRM